jgi:hypothetical protein
MNARKNSMKLYSMGDKTMLKNVYGSKEIIINPGQIEVLISLVQTAQLPSSGVGISEQT